MKLAKIITWIGLGAMTFGLLNGFLNGDFINDGKELLSNPWGVMSMIDLYVGFTGHRTIGQVHQVLWIPIIEYLLVFVLIYAVGILKQLTKIKSKVSSNK